MTSFSFSSLLPRRQCLPVALGLFLLWLIVAATHYTRVYLGPVSPDQLLFHLQNGGLDYADPRMLKRALRYLAAALALTVLCTVFVLRAPRWARRGLWLLLACGAAASVRATVADPCLQGEGDYLAQHYVDPATTQLRDERPPAERPDVLIVFIESLDEDFARAHHLEAPLLPQLARLREEHQTFGRLRNLSGASWTMGGLFTALCGVPLQPVGLMSRQSFEYATHFFRGGLCLPDVLAAQGWEASFYGGASLKFAGKGNFLAQHGVTRRFGREEWAARGVPLPPQGWGLLDAELASQAWADMQRPRDGDAPRLSILLTVDTHGPAGAADSGCPSSAAPATEADEIAPEVLMRDALRCTDAVVAKLARRFAAEANGRPKVVWIMGDHLSPTQATQLLAGDMPPLKNERTVFHTLARFDGQGRALPGPDQRRVFSHLDVLPTLAEAAGLAWAPRARHRLGLGSSLLSREPTLLEREGFAHSNGRLACTSPLFQRLWTRAAS